MGFSPCTKDNDCLNSQYCYDTSNICVDYTVCNRYNRKESSTRAKDASQCGPCFDGYEAEVVGTGNTAWICRSSQSHTEPSNNSIFIWLICGALIFSLVATFAFIFYKKQRCNRQNSISVKTTDIATIKPSAPPPENSPFIPYEEQISMNKLNNNQNLKDKNRLVAATPFQEPSWIRADPSYAGQHFNNDSMQQPNAMAIMASDDDTNPSNWTPEQNSTRQISIQLPVRPFAEFATEQRDNTLNAVLVQNTCPRNSSDSVNNDNNPSPEFSRSQGAGANNRTSNVILTQKINLNLNLLNGGDC
ncbi:uncharacterized protein [Prorops nasuta]|uniref:uncharacterized protein n=1 Tax=Prorops nasuta TaxID=863751 RepID=UPI0034CF3A44